MSSSSSPPPLDSKDLQRIFDALDQNRDGRLSLDELIWLLEKTGVVDQTSISPEDLVSLVGKEGLDFDEFSYLYHHSIWNSTTTQKMVLGEQEEEDEHEGEGEGEDMMVSDDENYYLYKAFKVFDVNDDGFISPEEIEMVLLRLELWNNKNHGMDCQKMIRAFDINSDGLVDFEEFKTMMLTVQ